MILRELNVDITPILTGAGIVGLAVGFGAQSLVKDIISGFFLILEDQVRVGDVANIDGTGGLVERITLRTIILRDETGTVHVIPNGSIQRLSNQTKDFSFYVTSVAVGYREDTDAGRRGARAASPTRCSTTRRSRRSCSARSRCWAWTASASPPWTSRSGSRRCPSSSGSSAASSCAASSGRSTPQASRCRHHSAA